MLLGCSSVPGDVLIGPGGHQGVLVKCPIQFLMQQYRKRVGFCTIPSGGILELPVGGFIDIIILKNVAEVPCIIMGNK